MRGNRLYCGSLFEMIMSGYSMAGHPLNFVCLRRVSLIADHKKKEVLCRSYPAVLLLGGKWVVLVQQRSSCSCFLSSLSHFERFALRCMSSSITSARWVACGCLACKGKDEKDESDDNTSTLEGNKEGMKGHTKRRLPCNSIHSFLSIPRMGCG